ncbi:MAG: glycosyltransferase family 4 protein [Phycisphaerales bacterium]|nr:glycosyltransferase family 4 protein [Phycisphaerales bacterium]
MHVALVMERIETWRGGAETSTLQFVHHLVALGCRVSIVTASYAPSTPLYTIVPIRANRWLRAVRTWLFAHRAAAYVRQQDFDIVHSITPCMAADVYQPRGGTVPETLARNLALRPRGRRGLKLLGQKSSLKYRVVGGLERRLLTRRPSPMVIAISRYVREQLARDYGLDSASVRLIFNGVDPDPVAPAQRREDRWRIRRQYHLADEDVLLLFVANNFKLKGAGRLLESLAKLRKNDEAGRFGRVRALLAGRDDPAGYIAQAQRMGLADQVIFAGPTQRINAFYHAADVLVHPTYYDPCSRVVLEAMSAGLPVITTRYNGAAELIREGQEGYVIDSPDDTDALADRIGRLTDPAQRQACAARAAKAAENCTMRRHAEQVVALYEEIIRSRASRPG